MYVNAEQTVGGFYTDIIREELNVKSVNFTDDVRDFTSYSFKPQLKTLGPKYGKNIGAIKSYLEGLDGNATMDELNTNGSIRFTVNDVDVELVKDDLLIDVAQKEGFISQENWGITVVLDTNLSEELINEGFVLEVISKVQTMRKDSGFEVMDHIRVSLRGNDRLSEVVKANEESISTKVLANEIVYGQDVANTKEWDINGEKVTIGVEKI
jgi:isoleucyl-tRNA synthetase